VHVHKPHPIFALTHVGFVNYVLSMAYGQAEDIIFKLRTVPFSRGLVVAGLKTLLCHILRQLSSLSLSKLKRSNGGNQNDMSLLTPFNRILVTSENSSLDQEDSYLQENYASSHISFPYEQHLSLVVA
jgi:hypothetical protein